MSTDDANEYQPLYFERSFTASKETVWDAWTKPEQFAQWYAPEYFSIPVCELNVEPGGSLRVDMQGPDGTRYPSSGTFREVKKPDRLVFTNSPLDSEGNKLFEVRHTIVLNEANGQTKLSIISDVVKAGPHAKPFLSGMEVGITQALQKLEVYIEADQVDKK
jgi:uncharacterized protein YndB with AHSA1/START domain